MVATNPVTPAWLKALDIDATGVLWSLLVMLALPVPLGQRLSSHSLVPNIGTPMPEPGTRALMLAGSILVGAMARRRARHARQG